MKPFKETLKNFHHQSTDTQSIEEQLNEKLKCKSKWYYDEIIKIFDIYEKIAFQNYWYRTLNVQNHLIFDNTYTVKIKNIRNKKFASFNYKVL